MDQFRGLLIDLNGRRFRELDKRVVKASRELERVEREVRDGREVVGLR